MTACNGCKWDYPDYLVSEMFTDQGMSEPLCGICALAMMNKIHGINQTQFNGEIAEGMRLEAISYRERHPKLAPRIEKEKKKK